MCLVVQFCRSFLIFDYFLKRHSFLASQIFTKLQKKVYSISINIYILPFKLHLCVIKCNFVDLVELSPSFWSFIYFWPHKLSLNFKKMFILSLSIFIFCLVNWIYVPCFVWTNSVILSNISLANFHWISKNCLLYQYSYFAL